ncbi:hypothetical protein [Kibdelosporangium aridum]|uniref:hypothetical protein n=1 Tax=Kibdelosporangium aridum TaxID=2030 RepID=UPI00190E8051|nr:hypothetical protein [Kibdelosporangium aridum]
MCRLEGRTVDVNEPGAPPWVPEGMSLKPWIQLADIFPWLPLRPYFLDDEKEAELLAGLRSSGFMIIDVQCNFELDDAEREFLSALSPKFGFDHCRVDAWSAFSVRIDEMLKAVDESPVAVVIQGLDELVRRDMHTFVRCVSNLISTTENLGYLDWRASRQVEYFFIGRFASSRLV